MDGSLWYDLTYSKCLLGNDRSQEPKPAPYVNDIKDTAAYYANRILKDFKGKWVDALLEWSKLTRILRDSRHAEWVHAFNGILDGMKRYVVEFHTTGLAWNVHVSIWH